MRVGGRRPRVLVILEGEGLRRERRRNVIYFPLCLVGLTGGLFRYFLGAKKVNMAVLKKGSSVNKRACICQSH